MPRQLTVFCSVANTAAESESEILCTDTAAVVANITNRLNSTDPEAVTDLKETDVTSRSVSLSWTKPNTSCAITYYNVSYEGLVLWGDNTPMHTGSNMTDVIEIVVGDLMPYTFYSFSVVAKGSEDMMSVYVTTEEDGRFSIWLS